VSETAHTWPCGGNPCTPSGSITGASGSWASTHMQSRTHLPICTCMGLDSSANPAARGGSAEGSSDFDHMVCGASFSCEARLDFWHGKGYSDDCDNWDWRVNMDWDKLRIFHAVAEAGSLTAAGETLHLSQSAVSRHIRALEESL